MFRVSRCTPVVVLAVAVAGVFGIPAIAPVAAASHPAAPPPAPRARQLEVELGEASHDEQVAVASVLAVRARREALDAKVREADGRVRAAGARAAAAESRAREIGVRYDALSAQLEHEARARRAVEARFRSTVAAMYRDGADSGFGAGAALVTGSATLHDTFSAARYLRDVGRARRRVFDELVAQRARTAHAREVLRRPKAAADAARAAAAREQSQLTALRDDRALARAAARAEEAHEAAVLAGVRARKGEFSRQLAALQASSQRIGEVLAGRGSGGTAPGRLRFPAHGPITSGFGPRVHPIFGDVRMHKGIDIGAGYGATVVAAADGVVVAAGGQTGYGNAVVIDHGGGLATLCGHLSRISVAAGQHVRAGQTVGAVGNSGYSTGPHLHFEVRVQGTPVDPMRYL